ncbi:hypothetical protein AB4Y36_38135 [Paraburkholderia sp. BR10936]|uniref:hypothetical protein n=1 Tax=Paraburkholderia sp. BR10936 TaxID=3236993 RepID=UPI0034D245B3
MDNPTENTRDSDDHLLCMRWADWHHSRRLYAPPPPKNLLAKMRVPDATIPNPPDAPNDPELNQLNRAIAAQPRTEQKMTFLCYYLWRIPVADLMTYYHLGRDGLNSRIRRFRERVILGQHALLARRYVDENVISLALRRRQSIAHCNATRTHCGRPAKNEDAHKTG